MPEKGQVNGSATISLTNHVHIQQHKQRESAAKEAISAVLSPSSSEDFTNL